MKTKVTAPNFLCIASFFKGVAFMRTLKECGANVYLLTSYKLKDREWPFDAIDSVFYGAQDADGRWNMQNVTEGLAYTLRSINIDRIVALDDFDVEKATFLREHFRIPGMGITTGNYFRDKLAMRMRAAEAGIKVPAFTALFNDHAIVKFLETTAAPWLIKPRKEASATGIKKLHTPEEFWHAIHQLGDQRHQYLAEQFKPGHVYHVDAITDGGKVKFAHASRYLTTPLEVSHDGGIFRSVSLEEKSEEAQALFPVNEAIMHAFGMNYSASHTEFIKCFEDGQVYFLETSSRVGGAHLAEMVEAATDINLWKEWARLEYANATKTKFKLSKQHKKHAGIIVSLTRQQQPDTSTFVDKEIWWRLKMDNHIGFIVQATSANKIHELLDRYAQRIVSEFHASAPPANKTIN
ncbi:MAG: hypothetical protein R2798_11300 [Chitinophagales bacterium]|nr:ATPase [Bacteroidota bacterium]MCB9043208.1 ATPase [Chitinophagales bacterium]